jgi:glutamine cyclotransferase
MYNLRKIKILTFIAKSVALLTLLVTACDPKPNKPSETIRKSPRIRKNVELVAPEKGHHFQIGESIEFEITHKADEGVIDSAFAIYNGNKFVLEGNKWTLNNVQIIGKQNIRLTAYVEGKAESLQPSIIVLPNRSPIEYNYQIVNTYPHDQSAWTQGLFFHHEQLYESTGQNGESSLRKVDIITGEVQSITYLEDQFFGEGSTAIDDRIYMLTWTSRKGFVYDLDLDKQSEFNYSTEGWGITSVNDTLVMSDGTEKLYFLDPYDFTVLKTIQVYDSQGKVDSLNELELIEQLIYANVWGEDRIVMIDPKSGTVVGNIQFDGIFRGHRAGRFDKSMNGIAVDSEGRIFVTGKYWPELYEIILTPKNNPI